MERISDEMVERAAKAIADAWGEKWACVCTSQRGMDCDCGDAMSDEREPYDERLSREDCRMGARAALEAAQPTSALEGDEGEGRLKGLDAVLGHPEPYGNLRQSIPTDQAELPVVGCVSETGLAFLRDKEIANIHPISHPQAKILTPLVRQSDALRLIAERERGIEGANDAFERLLDKYRAAEARAAALEKAIQGLLDCPDIADNDHKDEETHAAEREARKALSQNGEDG